MRFRSISKENFEAFFYGRTPYVKLFTTELEWFIFEVEKTTILAVMLRCEIDKDFNAVVLGRDMTRRFRAINVLVSKKSRDELTTALDACIDDLVSRHIDGIFPQGDERSEPFAIFNARVSEEKRNYYFKLLTEDPVYYPGRVIMEELAHWFNDPDGIFIRALQGNEFNARLFEIYLHAVFYELDFEMDRSFPQPDFLLRKAGQTISVEATTVAETESPVGSIEFSEESMKALLRYVNEEMPFKFARALLNKVKHRPQPVGLHYWELSHTTGHPFILAIHDYSRRMSMSFSSSAMQSYLYGLAEHDGKVCPIERHKVDNRTIPSNFFAVERHRHISAVMLATGATIPKFNRMGRIAGLRSPNSFAIIHGARTDAEGEIKAFRCLVEHPSYHEFWHEGIYIFHNPNANHPLDRELFPHVIHVFKSDDGVSQWVPPNYIVSSMTNMIIVDEDAADRLWREFDLLAKTSK